MIPLDAYRQPTTTSQPLRWFAKEARMITVRVDPDAETAVISTPEGDTTIRFAGRVGDQPVYAIVKPSGRQSTAHNFSAAVAYVLSTALDTARAIRKARRAA